MPILPLGRTISLKEFILFQPFAAVFSRLVCLRNPK